jgi:hypothetical protein
MMGPSQSQVYVDFCSCSTRLDEHWLEAQLDPASVVAADYVIRQAKSEFVSASFCWRCYRDCAVVGICRRNRGFASMTPSMSRWFHSRNVLPIQGLVNSVIETSPGAILPTATAA